MVFSSATFLFLFLPTVLLLYHLVPKYAKNGILLIASLFFYAWGSAEYSVLLLASIGFNYLFALWVSRISENGMRRRLVLTFAIIVNLSMLLFFKYADFVVTLINFYREEAIGLPNVLLPIGISFFTFQGMSYVIDVYRGDVKVNRNPFQVALYIAFFPQLIAGPIVKYRDVYRQIQKRNINSVKIISGIGRFITGLAKKVLISGTLGQQADAIWTHLYTGIDTTSAWLGILYYTLQIYFDFSGYSDMAIGLGRMFGFEFMENFNYPYIARTMTDFWRRWHISLSSWFKEYLYIPLGGNRRGSVTLHLLIVFLATGIWHGASLNFVLWGLWNGVFLILEKPIYRYMKKKEINLQRIPRMILAPIGWCYTMLVVGSGWVLFRAPDLAEAVTYFEVLLGNATSRPNSFAWGYYWNNQVAVTLLVAIVTATPVLKTIRSKWRTNLIWYLLTMAGLAVLLLLSITFIVNGTYNPFIYFQF